MGILDYLNFGAGGYDPNKQESTGQDSLLGKMPNIFMTQPGLANAFMTPEQQQQLQNQATKRGLLTGALTYLATPKNLGLGSAVPYLSKAYLGGMQGAQETYDTASKNMSDLLTLQKLGKQIELQGMTAGEKAQRWVDATRIALEKDPNNPLLKQQLKDAINQVEKETTKTAGVQINMPSESERTAGYLTTRLQNSLNTINRVISKNPNASAPSFGAEAVKFLTGSDYLKRLTNPAQRQIIENAQLDMLDAALTLGTGAAYTREQLEGQRQSFFPQLGESKEVIAEKRILLEGLLEAARTKAGRAAPAGGFKLPENVTVKKVEKK